MERDSRQKNAHYKEKLEVIKNPQDTERRGMIGERLSRVHEDHQQAEGQHNRQWMDKLIRHTSSEAGSGGSGYGQHP